MVLGQVMWIVFSGSDGFCFESERFSEDTLCSACEEVRTITMCQNTSAVIIYANLCFFFSSKESMVLGQVI